MYLHYNTITLLRKKMEPLFVYVKPQEIVIIRIGIIVVYTREVK